MLRSYPSSPAGDAPTPGSAIWLDLCNATPEELAEVEQRVGVQVPTRDSLSEIERSSRLRSRNGTLTMSMPMLAHLDGGAEPQVAPVGFVLSREHLVTIRYGAMHAFDAVAAKFEDPAGGPASGLEVFVELCDQIIDRLADNLEQAAAELGAISTATFRVSDGSGPQAIRSNQVIRRELRQVGRLGDRISEARDALLGIGRAVDFACELTAYWFDSQFEPRLRSLRQDVASLDDYEVHLSDKVQFLLDAMVGLIGIAQNEVFKVLTIVSIVGIPPTLVAGIYGMNFKGMPEYDWAFGYPYGLAVIALSAILPLVWFKWRGWF